MTSLTKNLGYQTIYQILTTCLPLITSPYLARVLGAAPQGVFSYTQSIVNYFVLIAMLGVANYGTRAIAEYKNDRKNCSIIFWEIYILQIIISLISILGYSVYLWKFTSSYLFISIIQGAYLLGALTDINWLFFGIEKFEITVKRNIIIKTLSVILMLVFVNKPSDLWIYTAIMAVGTFITNAVLWCFVYKVIDINAIWNITLKRVAYHIKPNFILFVPLLGMSVYHIMDKTMLGIFSTYEQVGYYYNADKIINIPIGVITGIGMVMLPRATAMIREGLINESDKLFNDTIEMVTCVSVAMAFGIASIAVEFTPLFFGPGFDECIVLIIALAPVLVIKGLSQTFRMQYLIPHKLETIFIQSVFLGAIVNFGVIYYLIPKLGAMGAVIGTLIAEIITFFWQYIRISKRIQLKKCLVKSLYYVFAGGIMFGCVRVVSYSIPKSVLGIIIECLVGAIVYSGLCFLFWYITGNIIIKKFFHR